VWLPSCATSVLAEAGLAAGVGAAWDEVAPSRAPAVRAVAAIPIAVVRRVGLTYEPPISGLDTGVWRVQRVLGRPFLDPVRCYLANEADKKGNTEVQSF